eukprot:TRINITY_DN6226_c0_g2_i1.p1 TRINITY_DN6226_c0_g2~~TRINITY_DN6226_c0_g2_i1.p1  ORF type:complete len:1109 (-),score=178.28 TRINITY_DN6226_c0_g2_i1:432-3758(-)
MGASPSAPEKPCNTGCPAVGAQRPPALVLLPAPENETNDASVTARQAAVVAGGLEPCCVTQMGLELCCARSPGPDRFYAAGPSMDQQSRDYHHPIDMGAFNTFPKQAAQTVVSGQMRALRSSPESVVAVQKLANQHRLANQLVPTMGGGCHANAGAFGAQEQSVGGVVSCAPLQEVAAVGGGFGGGGISGAVGEHGDKGQDMGLPTAASSATSVGESLQSRAGAGALTCGTAVSGANIESFDTKYVPVKENSSATPEKADPEVDFTKQRFNCAVVSWVVFSLWAVIFAILYTQERGFDEPVCIVTANATAEQVIPGVCDPCGSGTFFLPLFGEYEKSLPKPVRAAVYFTGLIWTFLGIGVVCDSFMGAIEEITSTEKVVWLEVRQGAKHKFHVKVWNDTVANLTLMALGSSAPEILLNVVELWGNDFFAGELGPSTIVGSAAFNMLIITAVCVSALPAPETRRIECTDVFAVTSTMSILAYVWLVIILQWVTPDAVDLWEALVTFAYFPLLVLLAFLADKKILFRVCQRGGKSNGNCAVLRQEELQAKFGKELPVEAMQLMLKQQDERDKPQNMSRAQTRATVMRSFIGGKKAATDAGGSDRGLWFGFKEQSHFVLECAGTLPLKVVANRPPGVTVVLRYCTVEGSAREGSRYTRIEGALRFGPHQLEKVIEIPIIDNDVWEENEDFYVELSNLQVEEKSSAAEPRLKNAKATVTILNDDIPGTLSFDADEIVTREGSVTTIGINRTRGTKGQITCQFNTVDGTAVSNRSFKPVNGILTFENGEGHQTIEVPIESSADTNFEDQFFSVVLFNASPGVTFDKDIDGGQQSAVCTLIIPANKNRPIHERCIRRLFNREVLEELASEWAEQFTSAFYCNGSPAEQAAAGLTDWFFHMLSLFWKVLFSLVPPRTLVGGWACFWSALVMIGIITSVVADLAGLLGCCLSIPDDITAITLVALGTSLPDTFASKVAAQQDATADNSVGNVTGSNSVNVFLGLGLPWTIGATFWSVTGRNTDWDMHRYKGDVFINLFSERYPSGGFMVPAGSLIFSVIIFVACAAICIATLIIRRRIYGGELGGPRRAQLRDSVFIAFLWVMYIVPSIIVSLRSQ